MGAKFPIMQKCEVKEPGAATKVRFLLHYRTNYRILLGLKMLGKTSLPGKLILEGQFARRTKFLAYRQIVFASLV